MSKTLITLGIVLIILGVLWPLLQKSGLGRLPGDITVEKEHLRFYFPLTTAIIISVVITILLWLFRK